MASSAITNDAMAFFIGKGWTHTQSAAIVGRLQTESGQSMNPTISHDNGTGVGIAGFRDPKPGQGRKTDLFNFASSNKMDWKQRRTQYAFLDNELRTTEKTTGDALRASTDISSASAAVIGAFRPQGWSQGNPTRGMGYKTQLKNAAILAGVEVDTSMYQDGNVPMDAIYGAGSDVNQSDLINPSPFTNQQRREQVAPQTHQSFDGVMDATGQIVEDSWSFTSTLRNMKQFHPDDSWAQTDEMLKAVQDRGLDIDDLEEARSQKQFDWMVERKQTQLDFEDKMVNLGGFGTAARFAAVIADPLAIGVALGTEGALGPLIAASKIAKLGRVATGAVLGGTGNLAAEAAINAADPRRDMGWQDAAVAVGVGLVWGGAFGALAKPGLAAEAKQFENAGKMLKRSAENVRQGIVTPNPAGVGAARLPGQLQYHPDSVDVLPKDAPYGFNAKGRFSTTGRLGGSKNPFARASTNAWGLNSVGMKDASVVVTSATETKAMNLKVGIAEKEKVYRPAMKSFRKDTGRSRSEFNREFSRGTRTGLGLDGGPMHPDVAKVVTWWQGFAKDLGYHMNNPFKVSGGFGRAIEGFQNFIPFKEYLPRIANHRAIGALAAEFEGNLPKMLSAAFRHSHPTASPELAERFGKGYLKRLLDAGAGVEDGALTVGGNADDLVAAIDNLGLSPQDRLEIDGLMQKMEHQQSKGTGPARGKSRTLFDEGFKSTVFRPDGSSREVHLDELWNNDGDLLMNHYINQTAGWRALGRIKVENPSQPGVYLIDGITSEADFAKFIKNLRQTGRASGQNVDQINNDVENFTFLYNNLRGIHEKFLDHEGADKAASWLRDLNYMRVGNQMGFPSMAEFTNAFSTIGIKAMMSQITGLRRMVDDVTGNIKFKDEYSQDIEAAFGYGADDLMGNMDNRHGEEEFFLGGDESSVSGKITKGLKIGRNITSTISFLRPVTRVTQMWVAKAAGQRFAQMARGGKWVATSELRSLGFANDSEMGAVLNAMRTHVTYKKGLLGPKIAKLNLDKWDAGTRSKFVETVNRWTRRVIQENDPGMQGRFLSKPFVKLLAQFRGFTLGAWDAQFQHNLYAFQNGQRAQASGYFLSAMFSGAAFHMARVSLASAGMEKKQRKEYLENNMSPEAIGGAAFSRAGWSSFLPGVFDTATMIGGVDNLFDQRSTGQRSDIGGFPVGDMINKGISGIGGTLKAVREGKTPTRGNVKALAGLAPFGNWMPAAWLLSHMVKDLK